MVCLLEPHAISFESNSFFAASQRSRGAITSVHAGRCRENAQMSQDVSDFQQQVIERSRTLPVVVDFWAEWCGPCRVLGPVLERLEQEAEGRWELARVDTDVHQDIAREFGIRGIPNVRLFVDGRSTAEFTGALPEPAVLQWLKKNLPDPSLKDIDQAQRLLQEGKTDEGIRILRAVLDHDHKNIAARVTLARALFPRNHAEAAQLVADIEADSEYHPSAEAMRTIADLESRLSDPGSFPESPVKADYVAAITAMARNDMDNAVDGFIRVVRGDKTYDDEGARRACIAIFRTIGDDSELSRRKRREFSSALFV